MDKELLKKLYLPFTLKHRPGVGGIMFDFIPSEDVINRMNDVFDGKWSTRVLSQDVVEDYVLIRVKVSIKDGYSDISHEGFGSSQIQRFSSGPKKDQLLDIGNAYKSAESKAIKNACTRFGVGLYLKEEDMPDLSIDEVPVEDKTINIEPTIKEIPEPTNKPKVEKVMTEAELPPFVYSSPPTVDQPPVENHVVDNDISLPPFPGTESLEKNIPSVSSFSNTSEDRCVSDVQKAALNGILAIKKVPLKELLVSSFKNSNISIDSVPDSIEQLSYKQAVAVIKYGNGIYRR